MHLAAMGKDAARQWNGWGRWLSFALGGLLILVAVPFVPTNSAIAGWNLLIGLVLCAAVATNHRKAPLLTLIVAVLMAVRLLLGVVMGIGGLDIGLAALLLALAAGAAFDLRRQDRRPRAR